MNNDLDRLSVFVAVAETKGFRAAGERLRISGSAVSQALRALEDKLGVALVHRTTRSVALTDAGKRLYAQTRSALADIGAAIAATAELGNVPRGTLRLHIAGAAEHFVSAEMLAGFLEKHAEIQLDLYVDDEQVDIVSAGYDAGIRLGEVIDRDMIAVPISGDLKLIVVGSPTYFAAHEKPKHPRDLVKHQCINWHPTENAPPYRWEFSEKGHDFAVDVRARVLTNEPALNLRLAAAGAGLTLADERRAHGAILRGELVPVLEEFCTAFPGFYLYYPERRNASPALRALVDHLRETRAKAARSRRKSVGGTIGHRTR